MAAHDFSDIFVPHLIVESNTDGVQTPVNCESNRRIAAAKFKEKGDKHMSARMCGFLFEFFKLSRFSEEFMFVKDFAGQTYQLGGGKSHAYSLAEAMEFYMTHIDP